MKKKSVILSIIVLLIGLMIVGGTFAFMTIQANITNTNYVGLSTCFLADYDIDDLTTEISVSEINHKGKISLSDGVYTVNYTSPYADSFINFHTTPSLKVGKQYVLLFNVSGLSDNHNVVFGIWRINESTNISGINFKTKLKNGTNKIVFNISPWDLNTTSGFTFDDVSVDSSSLIGEIFTLSDFKLYEATQDITGILFPSIAPSRGISSRVGLKVNDSCDVNGIGTLKLHINGETDSHLTEIATSHCEDKKTGDILTEYVTEESCTSANQKWKDYPTSYCESNSTLQVLKNYTTSASCTANNGTWVTNGSPLKYAVYNSSDTNGIPVSVGYITGSDIGNEITIYDDFVLTHEQRYFYVYIWLDGYLTDNTHSDLPFGGYINANAIQNDKLLPSEYEQVEYISSSGSQYIDTAISGNNNNLTIDIKYSWVTLPSSGVYAYVIGSYTNENSVLTRILQYGPSTTYFNVNTKAGGGSGVYNVSRNVDTIYNELLSSSGSVLTYNSNGTITNKGYVAGEDVNNNVCIFAASGPRGHSKIKLYSLKIYDGGNLVRDFIPCYHKTSGVRGLYDTVDGKFYTNAGSGTFGIPDE